MLLDTRISLYKLEVLCAVVKHGGLSRAAEQLYVTQPVVTAHIRSLEERLGVDLFERSGRGMTPTEEGHAVYIWAEDLLSRSNDMVRQLGDLAAGSFGVATIAAGSTAGTYILPKILIGFHQQYPDARVTLTQTSTESAMVAAVEGHADFAIVLGDEDTGASELLVGEPLMREPLLLVTRADGDGPDTLDPSGLAELRYVCSPSDGRRRRLIDQKLRAIGVGDREVILSCEHAEAIKQCVLADAGVAFLFRSTVRKELDEGTLREVVLSDCSLSASIFLVHRREKSFTVMQQSLLEHIRRETALNYPPVSTADPSGEYADEWAETA